MKIAMRGKNGLHKYRIRQLIFSYTVVVALLTFAVLLCNALALICAFAWGVATVQLARPQRFLGAKRFEHLQKRLEIILATTGITMMIGEFWCGYHGVCGGGFLQLCNAVGVARGLRSEGSSSESESAAPIR